MKRISEEETRNRENLFRLMKENPDLPVIPFVKEDVVAGDDFGSWMGSWGKVEVDEFLIPPNEWECVIFKSKSDVENVLEQVLTYEQFMNLSEQDEERKKYYDSLPWQKAIIVYIETPDDYEPPN